jgi:hypothetical protein
MMETLEHGAEIVGAGALIYWRLTFYSRARKRRSRK